MEKNIELLTPVEKADANAGTLIEKVNEITEEQLEQEQNHDLLEQINHKLDLLLSIEGK